MTIDQLLQKARSRQADGQVEDAVALYRQVAHERPDLVSAHVALGRLLIEKGDPASARRWLFQAIQHDPDQMVARKLLVEANLALDHLVEAHRWATEYLRVFPQDEEVRNSFDRIERLLLEDRGRQTVAGSKTLARLYLRQGHLRQAEFVLNELAAGSPDDPEIESLRAEVKAAGERNRDRVRVQLLRRLDLFAAAVSRARLSWLGD